jgi:hypothetical protein
MFLRIQHDHEYSFGPSYLSESKAQSRVCGHFFMGWKPVDGQPIKLNGAFYTNSVILKFVVASAAEAELGALSCNCQDGIVSTRLFWIWDIPNQKRRFIVTMGQWSAYEITSSKGKDCILWKCYIFGWGIK